MPLETSIPIYLDRHLGTKAAGQAAAAAQRSGVVDYFQVWDQMTSWYAQGLWKPENTPLASIFPDCDSFADVFAMSGYCSALAPDLGLVLSTDTVRRGPAEMVQSMLTLADLTEGRSIVLLAAGEIKQCKPYGWKRSHGLKRMEDLFEVYRLFMDNDGPVSFEGNHTTLQDAWIGSAKANRPHLWGLGGGPQLIDLCTSYADGFCTMCPWVWYSPERFAEQREEIRRQLESKGRDPDAFRYGIWATTLMHEDPEVVDQALDNKLTRWTAAMAGRVAMNDWDAVGIEPPMPRDWHYATKMLPLSMSDSEVEDMASRATREMAELSYFYGSPSDVAAQIKPYIDAGVDFVSIVDLLPFLRPVEEAQAGFARGIELSARLKGRPVPAAS